MTIKEKKQKYNEVISEINDLEARKQRGCFSDDAWYFVSFNIRRLQDKRDYLLRHLEQRGPVPQAYVENGFPMEGQLRLF